LWRLIWAIAALLALAGPACTCNRDSSGGRQPTARDPERGGPSAKPHMRATVTDRYQPGPGGLKRVDRVKLSDGRIRLGPPLGFSADSNLEQKLKLPGIIVPGRVRLSGKISPCGDVYLLHAQGKAVLVKLPMVDDTTYGGTATVEGRMTRDHRMLERIRAECAAATESPVVFVADTAVVKPAGN
jgi:hypothetical protein